MQTEISASAACYLVKRCERSSDQMLMDVTELVLTFCSCVTASKKAKTGGGRSSKCVSFTYDSHQKTECQQ